MLFPRVGAQENELAKATFARTAANGSKCVFKYREKRWREFGGKLGGG